jgi:hypothetical protein
MFTTARDKRDRPGDASLGTEARAPARSPKRRAGELVLIGGVADTLGVTRGVLGTDRQLDRDRPRISATDLSCFEAVFVAF